MLETVYFRFKRMLGGQRRMLTTPDHLLHGREQAYRPPALFLPNQIEKVRGVQEETTLAHETARVLGGEVTHGATAVYKLTNAKVVDGYIYSHEGRLVVSPKRERGLLTRSGVHLKKALLTSSYNGNRYFGHWLSDDCTRALIEGDYGRPLFTGAPWTDHQRDYRRLLGLPAPPAQVALVETLYVIPDVGQNAHKRARLEQIRAATNIFPGRRRGHGVFVLRGQSGAQRYLENESQIAAQLTRYGFEIVDPAKENLACLLNKMKNASVVVGVEGSHLMHALFAMQPGGLLLTIQPPDRFNNVFKDLTDALGNRYGFVLGEGGRDGFTLNLKDLLLTLDLAEQNAPTALAIA